MAYFPIQGSEEENILEANNAAIKNYGYSREEFFVNENIGIEVPK